MFKLGVVFVLFFVAGNCDKKPMIQYRYESKDVMETDASSYPVQRYHLVQGGYYPGSGFGGFGGYAGGVGIGGGLGYGPGKIGSLTAGGFYPGYIGQGIGGGGVVGGFNPYYQGVGGEYFDKNTYENENKNINDGRFEKASGTAGESFDRGQEGFSHGNVGAKNIQGDSGYYNNFDGGKKVIEDGKSYQGGQHFNEEGKNAGENKQRNGHKKGHVVKGFKTSHHKDETGKTEEYYDEANDEGNHFQFKGQSGGFGENAQSAYKGGHENKQLNAEERKKQGHYDTHQLIDNSKGDQGRYGEKKYAQLGRIYGQNNGIDEQSLLGHQESVRAFKHPYHVPFFHH